MTDSLIELWQSTGVYQIQWDQAAMIVLVCCCFIWPSLRSLNLCSVPIGFGGILANIPGVDIAVGDGILYQLYSMGIGSGLFPLLIFMGVGAMTDFGPLLANPRTLFLGAAAQFGIFATLLGALVLTDVGIFDFTIAEAAAIGIIGGADGPTAIYVAGQLAPQLLVLSPLLPTPTWRWCHSFSHRLSAR